MSDKVREHPLWVYNSLGRKKVPFEPLEKRGREVTWYCCGPTVYDAGHLGHARNYVTTDILRRILVDYFGYNVEFVMNIILRARQQHLLRAFEDSHSSLEDDTVLKTALVAFNAYSSKNLPKLPTELDPAQYDQVVRNDYGGVLDGQTISEEGVPGDAEAKVKMHAKTLSSAAKVLVQARKDPTSLSTADFYQSTADVLLPHLDSLQGSNIRADDYGIFSALTTHWEKKFEEDLKMLNCLPPSALTRVTEFVPQIVHFVERIVSKGFGYPTTDGSVYFDSRAFEKAGNTYARLTPWNRNNKELQADGEGALSKKKDTEKKSEADFALWKASKPGEPSWNSPWGKGRPGWHIECSAMASEVLGSQIDIHSGGIDLAFPHHDNELAQSEAYWVETSKDQSCTHQHDWIKYFLHMGHLSIQGSKMSKSLKNFTTIDAALRKEGGWTARGLRIVFLMGGWRDPIEVTDDVVKAAGSWESALNNFFTVVRALMSEEIELKHTGKLIKQSFEDPERNLRNDLKEARINLYDAMCDSFNTPLAMNIISDLISKTNAYMSKQKAATSLAGVKEVARWVTRIVDIFGLDASRNASDGGPIIGWSTTSSSGEVNAQQDVGFELFVRSISSARDELRQAAISNPESVVSAAESEGHKLHLGITEFERHANINESLRRFLDGVGAAVNTLGQTGTFQGDTGKKNVLGVCDDLRNNVFPEIGVWLDDRDAGQPALVKFMSKTDIFRAQEQKKAEAALREQKKDAAKLEQARIESEKAEQGKLNPKDMFRTSDYTAWDEDGIPTKDDKGEEVTKSRRKKLGKDWERQKRKYESWLLARKENA
ncbi:MAG: hypothetical protein M1833_001788 [Piccolia ochrophora]|nr:MAG: hypothetical protein M1833_001788 [Piccolia ochrophora]